jgi:hypothetical protein
MWTFPTNDNVRYFSYPSPDAEFELLMPPKGPEGLYGAAMWYPSMNIYGDGGAFGHKTSDEKVTKIMQIQNEILADRDLFNTVVYGIEGMHWERGPEGEIIVGVDKQAHEDGVYFWGRFPLLRDEDETLTKRGREIYDWAASVPVNYMPLPMTV